LRDTLARARLRALGGGCFGGEKNKSGAAAQKARQGAPLFFDLRRLADRWECLELKTLLQLQIGLDWTLDFWIG
jgi:hypothetical protein